MGCAAGAFDSRPRYLPSEGEPLILSLIAGANNELPPESNGVTRTMAKYYTIEEANAALPRLVPLITSLMATQERILAMRPHVQDVVAKSEANSGSATASRLYLQFIHFEAVLEKIREMGVEVKDVSIGLCDFVALHQGRDIYLCWHAGEAEVLWWHELHTGFAGRRHVDELRQTPH